MRCVIGGVDADAVIDDRDPHFVFTAASGRDGDGAALGRELHGVREQVDENLVELARIGLDHGQIR